MKFFIKSESIYLKIFLSKMFIGDFCKPCECNGNINTTVTGACNDITGICQECLYNTFGDHCERCEDWYYGDAIEAKNCRGKNE